MTTRKGRLGNRPLAVKKTMHIVMRSSIAKGERSFRARGNKQKIDRILKTHAEKNSIRLISYASVGNHLHLHIQLGYRDGYKRFIRAVTAAIAMHVMNWNRWTMAGDQTETKSIANDSRFATPKEENSADKATTKQKFWDFRPYSNVVTRWTGFKKLREYISVKQYEELGIPIKISEELVRTLKNLRAEGLRLLELAAKDGPSGNGSSRGSRPWMIC